MSEEKKEKTGKKEIFSETLDIKGEKTVGEILLEARERSGLSLEAVSQETKLPKKSLEYLETDNFESIPAKVYVTGFLRTYARVLGLDVSQILNKYEVQTGQTHRSRGDCWEIEESTIEETIKSPKVFKKYFLPAIALILLIIVVIWLFSKAGADKADLPEDPDAAARQEESLNRKDPEVIVYGQVEGASGEEVLSDASLIENDRPADDQKLQTAALKQTQQEKNERGEFELRILANRGDTTWFDIVIYTGEDSGADSIFHDFILYPGQIESFRTKGSVLFRTIGNAGGFIMERNGLRLPSLGRRGLVRKNIRITESEIIRE